MMSEICPLCSMPNELCVCEDLKKSFELKRITPQVKINLKKGNRNKTIIALDRLNPNSSQVEKLMEMLRCRLNCGAACKNNSIILYGDHTSDLARLLPWMLPNVGLK